MVMCTFFVGLDWIGRRDLLQVFALTTTLLCTLCVLFMYPVCPYPGYMYSLCVLLPLCIYNPFFIPTLVHGCPLGIFCMPSVYPFVSFMFSWCRPLRAPFGCPYPCVPFIVCVSFCARCVCLLYIIPLCAFCMPSLRPHPLDVLTLVYAHPFLYLLHTHCVPSPFVCLLRPLCTPCVPYLLWYVFMYLLCTLCVRPPGGVHHPLGRQFRQRGARDTRGSTGVQQPQEERHVHPLPHRAGGTVPFRCA